MKISFNRDHLTVSFQVENEEDLLNAYQLEKLVQTSDWQILVMAWANVRKLYEDAIKKVKPSNVAVMENLMKSAAFNGFDEAICITEKIVNAAKAYREDRKKEFDAQLKEDRNETHEVEYIS